MHLYRITLTPAQLLGVCPQCHRACDTVHQTRTRDHIKDLPIGPEAVELSVRVPPFSCPCGHGFTPPVGFAADGAQATERFLERAADVVRRSDVADAAGFLGVPERTLGEWYYAFLQRRPTPSDQPLKIVRRIGIDELALKKNPRGTSR